MRKPYFLLLLAAALLLILPEGQAQNSRRSPHETVEGNKTSVSYGRPYKKGRELFGALVPYNKVWRTGADEATTLTLAADATIGGEKIAAGTYALFTKPGEENWTIILNSEAEQWGAYNYDAELDVATIEVPVTTADKEHEQLTVSIATEGSTETITIAWGTTAVAFDVKF